MIASLYLATAELYIINRCTSSWWLF